MASKEQAITAVEELLATEYPGEGLGIESLLYFDDDGDGTYAFALLSGDPASYVHADGVIRWNGSRLGTPDELAEVAFENAQGRSNV